MKTPCLHCASKIRNVVHGFAFADVPTPTFSTAEEMRDHYFGISHPSIEHLGHDWRREFVEWTGITVDNRGDILTPPHNL